MKLEYYPTLPEKILSSDKRKMKHNQSKWDAPFFTNTNTYITMEEIKEAAGHFNLDEIENIIVLGTGGSIQTLSALKHLAKKRIFEITSSRAVELKECLESTRPDNSIVIPISRGGETLDVNSTIGIFLEKKYHFLGLSSRGTMNKLLKQIECPILDVPDLSGRFAGSMTNVGIVPSYLAGINVDGFLKSLNQAYNELMDVDKSKSVEFASYLFQLYLKGYKVVFSLPYTENIEGSVGLFVQEISESTGKEEKGLMGAFQSAPLAQHSVLEYLLGGTKGAVVPILWTIDKEIPDITLSSSIDHVDNQTAQTIVNFQADATFQALIEQGVPSGKISLETPNEHEIAHLIAFIQSTIYHLCLLIDVNWANNPKVVIGKKICNEALEKNASLEERKQVRKRISQEKFNNFYE